MKISLFLFSALISFFFFTSCENPITAIKKMDIQIPKDSGNAIVETKADSRFAITILLDGNKNGKLYYYEGKFDKTTVLNETTLDSLDIYVTDKNKSLIADMSQLRMQKKKGGLSDSLYSSRKKEIESRHEKETFMFIIKWGGNAKYGEVINVVDILKRCDANKYALTTISKEELTALSAKTGTHYPELDAH